MPRAGTVRRSSFTRSTASAAAVASITARAGSTSPVDSATGYQVVNQPTDRARSAPGTKVSSRPWPSRPISTRRWSTPRPARHAPTAAVSAPSRTSLTCAVSRCGTSVSTARVTAAGIVISIRAALA